MEARPRVDISRLPDSITVVESDTGDHTMGRTAEPFVDHLFYWRKFGDHVARVVDVEFVD